MDERSVQIELSAPEYQGRIDIMRSCLQHIPVAADLDLPLVSGMMALASLSPAQLSSICSSAALLALQEEGEISTAHLKSALVEHLQHIQKIAIASVRPQ
mmetsp:Transcript_31880/g.64093  ORF Transcript_31880/g.64093 Transcript_31880/m.64093 type:complete len:100 (+) Transcript_31880:3-302(+)